MAQDQARAAGRRPATPDDPGGCAVHKPDFGQVKDKEPRPYLQGLFQVPAKRGGGRYVKLAPDGDSEHAILVCALHRDLPLLNGLS